MLLSKNIFFLLLSSTIFLCCKSKELENKSYSENISVMSKDEQEIIISHEKDRELIKINQDVVIYNNQGERIAQLFKGAIIRDASIYDLESGDIGEANLYSLIFKKSGDINYSLIGDLIDSDEIGVGSIKEKGR